MSGEHMFSIIHLQAFTDYIAKKETLVSDRDNTNRKWDGLILWLLVNRLLAGARWRRVFDL